VLERVGARASRQCPASLTRVRGAPGSSQHAKCSVGPVGEQVELSASPRRPAASAPRRGSARWPTARFDRATRPAARRHSSVPPPPPRSRLKRSACPGSGGTITTAASPMRHELALPARLPRAPQQRGVEARPGGAVWRRAQLRCAHLNGEHLCVGGWVVGWVTARTNFVMGYSQSKATLVFLCFNVLDVRPTRIFHRTSQEGPQGCVVPFGGRCKARPDRR